MSERIGFDGVLWYYFRNKYKQDVVLVLLKAIFLFWAFLFRTFRASCFTFFIFFLGFLTFSSLKSSKRGGISRFFRQTKTVERNTSSRVSLRRPGGRRRRNEKQDWRLGSKRCRAPWGRQVCGAKGRSRRFESKQSHYPTKSQVAGSIFPFTNRVFEVPGLFDPHPFWAFQVSQLSSPPKLGQTLRACFLNHKSTNKNLSLYCCNLC